MQKNIGSEYIIEYELDMSQKQNQTSQTYWSETNEKEI